MKLPILFHLIVQNMIIIMTSKLVWTSQEEFKKAFGLFLV